MDYIVLDVEWNQGEEKKSGVPSFEIIEIGAVKLNEHFEIVDSYQSLVKPQIYDSMHKITEELVHLHIEDMKDARTFPVVIREFLQWCGMDCMFCIWGVQDLSEIQKNMDYYKLPPISCGPIRYYDVQKLYSIAYADGKQRFALSHVVEEYQLTESAVPFHRAYGDAYYTAKIFQKIVNGKLLRMVSFDTYHIPEQRKDQILWKFDTYTKFISQGYRTKEALLADKNVSCVRCIYCEKALHKEIPWYTPNNGKHYYTVAKCAEHGFMKGKNRIRKDREERYFAIKTTKPVTGEEAQQIKERKLYKSDKKRGKNLLK